MNNIDVDVAIIGAGPAGISAAIELANSGMKNFILIEREKVLGGILNQCIHNGFGLQYFKKDLTGPQFAKNLIDKLYNTDITNFKIDSPNGILTSAIVTKVIKENDFFKLTVRSKEFGLLKINVKSVITATGCRERTRENIEIPGTRPAGIFTAGQAQALVNKYHYAVGTKIIIQGSGDIGLIMARRFTLEGFKVIAVFERLPYLSGSIRNKVQCLDHFNIPLYLSRQISEIKGKNRVSSVKIKKIDENGKMIFNSDEEFHCDTVLFATGLIPELEAVKYTDVNYSDGFSPDVNSCFETNVEGLFASGNCLHINDLADSAAIEGKNTASFVLEYLSNLKIFRQKVKEILPYKQQVKNVRYNLRFFADLESNKQIVCIICPKGCILSEEECGCPKGKDYFDELKKSFGAHKQRISTTIEIDDEITGKKKIIPVVTDEEIPIEMIPKTILKIKGIE